MEKAGETRSLVRRIRRREAAFISHKMRRKGLEKDEMCGVGGGGGERESKRETHRERRGVLGGESNEQSCCIEEHRM